MAHLSLQKLYGREEAERALRGKLSPLTQRKYLMCIVLSKAVANIQSVLVQLFMEESYTDLTKAI